MKFSHNHHLLLHLAKSGLGRCFVSVVHYFPLVVGNGKLEFVAVVNHISISFIYYIICQGLNVLHFSAQF